MSERNFPHQQSVVVVAAPAADGVLRQRLKAIDVNETTPLEALRLLAELKRESES